MSKQIIFNLFHRTHASYSSDYSSLKQVKTEWKSTPNVKIIETKINNKIKIIVIQENKIIIYELKVNKGMMKLKEVKNNG